MGMSGVKIRDNVGWKFRENPFWFKLAQGFELPGKNSLKLMYYRNPVIINFDLSSHKGLSNMDCTYFILFLLFCHAE